MLVNSVNFLLFFSIVFIVYYFLLRNNAKAQNIWLLLAISSMVLPNGR